MLRHPLAFLPFSMLVAAFAHRLINSLWTKRREILCALLVGTMTQCTPTHKQQPSSEITAQIGYETALQRMLTGIRTCYGSNIIDHELDAQTKMAVISIYTPQTMSSAFNSGIVPLENNTSNLLNVKIIDHNGSTKLILSDGSFAKLSQLWLANETRCTKG